MNKLLVIGSNSFSGQNLISHALERDIEVYGMSRSEEKSQVELAYDKEHFNYQFIQCDINNHREVLEIFNFMRPNYIVNFAAQSEVAHSWKQPEDWIDTNVKAVTHLADLLKDSKYLKNSFIHPPLKFMDLQRMICVKMIGNIIQVHHMPFQKLREI